MIAFLTVLYGGVLYLLVRFKVVPWNTFWKASPAIWLVLLFVVIVIPMNWGAPSGPVLVLRQSVSIVPNVAGEVIDVPVQANKPLKAGDVLFRIDPAPYAATVNQIRAQIKLAEINLERASELEKRQTGTLATLQQRQAELDQLKAQLEAANWNLEKTVVRAPTDGFVTNVGLRKGARVSTAPISAVMAFIETTETAFGVQVQQAYARNIEPGQQVEIAFKFLPGSVYSGRVVAFIQATASGQQTASGSAVGSLNIQPAQFYVRVDLDDKKTASLIPAGATGEAAIYTESASATHVVRRIMIRMTAYLNYVLPY
jgi:RND family efflux transporter MFP subunit